MKHVCDIVWALAGVHALQRAKLAGDGTDVRNLGDDVHSEDAFATVYAD